MLFKKKNDSSVKKVDKQWSRGITPALVCFCKEKKRDITAAQKSSKNKSERLSATNEKRR